MGILNPGSCFQPYRPVDKSHVAARITPYGSSTNLVPRFNHSPGNDMRIATRRPDGAWEFSTPGAAFNPTGVDEIEPPASASTSMYSPTPTRSTFKVPMTPTTPTKLSASFQSPFPPTPETPSFPPGLPPSIPPSLPPSTPTTPRNVTTFAAAASSSSSPARPASQLTTMSMEPPKSPAQIMKEHESRAARLIRQGYDDREFSDEAPPPAYGHDPCYLDHTKEPSLE
ncbi:hypothetical protein M378DRAFT_761688 [Amanita muscaria Koide BX008]|uniref:Uncharacterized protein n=1 Tax=Amanita muscaria (strain Koide BX008) TaxID=946122 RepID=A0A0C2T7G7_AMAMK|nr:hypothetical protein M378DRAFT_761688 [Amanita muscaria Koide BX008]